MKTNQLIKHISIRVTRIILLLLAVQRLLTLSFSFIFVHFIQVEILRKIMFKIKNCSDMNRYCIMNQ